MASIVNSLFNSASMNQFHEERQNNEQKEFFQAIKKGATVEELGRLVQYGANVSREYNGETPLSIAMRSNQLATFAFLLKMNANFEHEFDYINGKKYPLIWYALWENQMPYFKMLINQGRKNFRNPENNQTLLIAATNLVNPEAVSHCLSSNKMNVNDVDNIKRTALHYALSTPQSQLTPAHQEIISMLINAGANPQLVDLNGNTPREIFDKANKVEELRVKQEMELKNNPKPSKKYKNKNKYGMNKKRQGYGIR